MANGTEPTQEAPEVVEAPQNLEGDPGKVVDVFKEAASHLEYTEDTPEEAKPDEPEVEAAPEDTPEKPPKKRTKKAKDEPVTEPKEETPIEAAPEPEEEPRKSKRELFKEKADAEKAYREKEAKLKEREAAAQAAEQRYKDFDADPIKYLEAKDPKFYEKLTQRYLNEGKTPDQAENASIKAEIAALREEIKGRHEETTTQVQQAQYAQYMNETKGILAGEEFKDVHESAKLYEQFTGAPVDYERAIASVWSEYKSNYGKELTSRECCEILLEDAQAHIERVADQFGQKKPPAETKPKKKTPPTSGKTLTQKQETQSAPAPEKPQTFASKEDMFRAVSEGLEYEEPEE